MTRSLRVVALQLRAHDCTQFQTAFDAIVRDVDRAAAGADLVVLPEATIPGYVIGGRDGDTAAVERALERLRDLAQRHKTVIVAGAAVRDGGDLYNAAVAIDSDGSVAGRAEKIFLWHFDRRWFSPGTRIAPIETSAGRLGVLVCADGRMPEISRALVDAGAELLVMPTAWVSSGRNPAVLENAIADVLAPVRARENGVPFIAADKCGVERAMVLYCGKSQIVSPEGEVLALGSEREPCALAKTLSIGEPMPRRAQLPHPSHREAPLSGTVRVALSAAPLPSDFDDDARILETPFAIAPGADDRIASLDVVVPVARVDDSVVNDPGGLPALRRAGYRVAIWETRTDEWTELLARARAGETRMYVFVIDSASGRAFAVDPDYTIVCGTFGEYRIASCAVDFAKTAQTLVVPGTDIAEGLERVHAMTAH